MSRWKLNSHAWLHALLCQYNIFKGQPDVRVLDRRSFSDRFDLKELELLRLEVLHDRTGKEEVDRGEEAL